MKHTKTKTIPSKIVEVTDFIECDMCGKRSGKDDFIGDGACWGKDKDGYNISTTINVKRAVYDYGGGGESKIIEAHICDECMINKVFEYLKGEGIEIHSEETDW
jgi:hypothetical protein